MIIVCKFDKLLGHGHDWIAEDCELDNQNEDDLERYVLVRSTSPYINDPGTGKPLQLEVDGGLELDMAALAAEIGDSAFDYDAMYLVYCWVKGFPEIAHAKETWYRMGTDWLRGVAEALGWLRYHKPATSSDD